jgi:hypothetical protein
MKTHFVCWAAQRQNGTVAAPVESFESERAAIANFHIRAGQAANGDNLKDTVVLFTADGFQMMKASFEHAPVNPE